jgi:hypothetical protein
MQEQSTLNKKKWRKIVDKGARALAYAISTKLYNGDVKDDQCITAIQQSFIFYHEHTLDIAFTEIPY